MPKRLLRCLSILAALLAAAALSAAAPAPADTHRTEVITLKAMNAERAITIHQRVLGAAPGARLVPGRDGKTLVVYDTVERLARFRVLLRELDRPTASELRTYVRPVAHRSPSELAELARQVLGDAAAPTMVPDDRAGLLVVQATRPGYAYLDKLLRRLDVRGEGERAIRVTRSTESGQLPPLPGTSGGGGGGASKSEGATKTKSTKSGSTSKRGSRGKGSSSSSGGGHSR